MIVAPWTLPATVAILGGSGAFIAWTNTRCRVGVRSMASALDWSASGDEEWASQAETSGQPIAPEPVESVADVVPIRSVA